MESMWEQMLQPGIELRSFGWGIKIKKDWFNYMAK